MKPRSNTIVITPPAIEPVTVPELLQQLGMQDCEEPAICAQMARLLLAARMDCEDDMRRVLMLQTREMQLDHFPYHAGAYERGGCGIRGFEGGFGFRDDERAILVPCPPLMAIESLTYIDLTGTPQTIPCDTTFGAGPDLPAFTYQRTLGTETMPGRVAPGIFRWWPPTWTGEAVVKLRFRCGYNGPVTVTTTAESAIVASSFVFLQDDIGRPIAIPGAGVAGEGGAIEPLVSSIASIDTNGVATLADNATTAAGNAVATFGIPVPEPIRQAILIRAQAYYNNSYDDQAQKFVCNLLNRYTNRTA